ncbi:mucin-2 [Syngnathoides biaculeatus]|uniref:mucin-2 n=1 Tax=Syngnathoides biaculeatus TaxID=300417 RepID=UPI002ADE2390|nr:mucin-2 [Syngnathoides biaculeatus]
MMAARMCIYLGALVMLHVGSAEHGNEHTAQPIPERDLDFISHAPTIAPKGSNSTSTGNSAATHWEKSSAVPQPSRENATNLKVTSATSIPEKSIKPSVPPTLTFRAPNTTSPHSPSNTTHSSTTSHQPPEPVPVSTVASNRTALETHPPATSPLSRIVPHKTTTTTQQSTASTPATTTQQSTTSTPATTPADTRTPLTTSSSRETSTSRPTTLTSLQTSSGRATVLTTVAPPGLTSTQAKLHPDTPSQLNVKGDTIMVHDSPKLDPLLAGLVSAFIISAAVITLLLFLKLRRRDNRPEFRRLQDLPMDDMMEETPLSMYSY